MTGATKPKKPGDPEFGRLYAEFWKSKLSTKGDLQKLVAKRMAANDLLGIHEEPHELLMPIMEVSRGVIDAILDPARGPEPLTLRPFQLERLVRWIIGNTTEQNLEKMGFLSQSSSDEPAGNDQGVSPCR